MSEWVAGGLLLIFIFIFKENFYNFVVVVVFLHIRDGILMLMDNNFNRQKQIVFQNEMCCFRPESEMLF